MLCEQLDRHELRPTLYQSLGYDPASKRLLGDGPMATIPRQDLIMVIATVLYQQRLKWHDAYSLAESVFHDTMLIAPSLDDLRTLADLQGLFDRLGCAGVNIAIATSDDRDLTEAMLALLGLHTHINEMVCGDDALPAKPAPDGLFQLAERFEVDPARIMMVGDTDCDMRTGRNAGVGCCLGVLSGGDDHTMLAENAHIVVDSVAAIQVGNT